MDVERAAVSMRKPRKLLAFLIVLFAFASVRPRVVRAQEAATAAPPTSACVSVIGPEQASSSDSVRRTPAGPARPDTTRPALRLFASVQASEVSFARQPQICVRLNGDARLDSVRIVGRRNLTSPVVSGTTYRDVYVAVEILGHLNAECIAARITGAPTTTDQCASLGIRDTSAVRRPGTSPP